MGLQTPIEQRGDAVKESSPIQTDPEYPGIDFKKEGIEERPGLEAAALLLADMTQRDARDMRDNPDAHEKRTLTDGFTVTVETADGMVGLWSCWLRDALFLGYPTDWGSLPDHLVESHFPGIRHEPRYREKYGRAIGQWTLPDIDLSLSQDDHDSNLHHFPFIDGERSTQYGIPEVAYGWGVSESLNGGGETGLRLRTEPFPENRDVVTPLTPNFIALMCDWANAHNPIAVNVELGFVFVPEQLAAQGYESHYAKGQPGVREGWNNEIVYGRKGDEEILLRSANSLVPWVCYRRMPTDKVTPEFIEEMLTI